MTNAARDRKPSIRWLLLRRTSQLGILALFLAGPWFGLWIVKGNLSFSYTLNTLPLADGMVFSDEPGVYFPGAFGIRIEDTVLCTANGARRLNEATRVLTVMS